MFILRYLRNTGTLRVDPSAGTLGYTMDRAARHTEPSGRNPGDDPTHDPLIQRLMNQQ